MLPPPDARAEHPTFQLSPLNLIMLLAALVGIMLAAVPTSFGAPTTTGSLIVGTHNRQIFTMKPDGSDVNVVLASGNNLNPALSPDGSRIAYDAFTTVNGERHIFVIDVDGSDLVQLTFGTTFNQEPAWSPDGSKLAFISNRDGNTEIFVMNADGSSPTQVTFENTWVYTPDWSPDGSKLVYARLTGNETNLAVVPTSGGSSTSLTSASGTNVAPAWSSDGSSIAFLSSRAGSYYDIYRMSADGSGQTRVTIGLNATDMAWAPDDSAFVVVAKNYDLDPEGKDAFHTLQADGTGLTLVTDGMSGSLEYADWGRSASATPTATATSSGPALTNLALNKPATADATCVASETAAKAVNGVDTDKWCSLNHTTAYLQVDLQDTAILSNFVLKHAQVGGELTVYNTRDFNIQVSDDAQSWTTVVTVEGNTSGTTTHPITPITARYVKLNVTNGTSLSSGEPAWKYAARIYEFEVYGVVSIGEPTATATATDEPTATATATDEPTATDGTPYGGSAATIPGRIQAENYNLGGEGVAYHDLEASNIHGDYRPTEGVDVEDGSENGCLSYNVGEAVAGEWINYTVDVANSGVYDLYLRVSMDGPGGTFHVEMDGANVTGPLTVPNTGGWQNWQTFSVTGINLSAGRQTMRLVMDAQNVFYPVVGNFNWVEWLVSGDTLTVPDCRTATATATDEPTPTATATATDEPTATATATRTATATVTRSNLLRNGGFEADSDPVDGKPDRWSTNSAISRSNASVHGGSYSMRHFSTGNVDYASKQTIAGVQPLLDYTFSGWVNIPATTDTFSVKMQLQWLDSAGAVLRTDTVKSYSAKTAGWVKFSQQVNAPAGTAKVRVGMKVTNLAATIYMDNFDLR